MSDVTNVNSNDLFGQIKEVINASKDRLFSAVNAEMVLLYWNIGRIITSEILNNDKAEYGKSIIRDLEHRVI